LTLDVLAIGAHPDDVEIGCGGTIARLSAAGRRVGILHLTSGEAGTRGTPEQRRREAAEAGRLLGAERVEYLELGDGGLRAGRDAEDDLIRALRASQPKLVFAPAPHDRHPDHERAHRLVVDAAFYAGLAKRGTGEPHRPDAVWFYMLHHPFEPQLVVDVTKGWPAKMAALDAYESQLHRAPASRGPEQDPLSGHVRTEDGAMRGTLVSSPDFRAAIEGRARHYGLMVGATFGEPFFARTPLRVEAPSILQGLR
jgi:bacillithiol biosynthesis deacetylase BshB1